MAMSSAVESLPWTDSRNVRTFQRLMASRDVGRRIAELRKRLRPKVSQEDLAAKIGVRSETVSRWERGASGGYYDDEKVLDKLATALEVKPEDIVGPPQIAEPGQLDRFEARLDDMLDRIEELRLLLKPETPPDGVDDALQDAEAGVAAASQASSQKKQTPARRSSRAAKRQRRSA